MSAPADGSAASSIAVARPDAVARLHSFAALGPLAVGWLLMAALVASAAGQARPRQELLEVRDSRLYVQVSGSGKPIVFLHGGLHHFDNSFGKQRDDFARSRTVVGIDQRGHGHSPDDARPFSYQDMADDTAEVIRRLGLGPVDVVGHSDGGNVALILARTHPDLVRRVVVSGANLRPNLPPDEVQARMRWSPEQWSEFLSTFERRLPPGFRADYQAVTPDGAAHWSVVVAKSYRLWLTPVVIDAAGLAAIQAPVLVIAGDKDFASLEETAEIYRGLRQAQLFIVPGTGHGTFFQTPELVNPAIHRFLDAP
jgi:pimeloyl-ACP methyl ester carboxylesterase